MVAGNPYVRNFTDTPEANAISWLWSVSFICTSVVTGTDSGPTTISLNFTNSSQPPQTPGLNNNTICPDGLRAQIFFPSCWDGKNLDSADHKSHMAYPDGVDSGICPSTHPVRLVSIFFEVWNYVREFNDLNDGGHFALSNGDPTGYGLHGDFMNGWDSTVLSRAVDQCRSDTGVIEDCPVFQNEGRFYSDSEMNSCAAKNPLPDEQTGPGALLPYLPGCVALTGGPGPATPEDLVPGCVVGSVSGSGTGSVSPIPSSSAASSASSSSAANSAPPLVDVASISISSSATPSQASDSSSSTSSFATPSQASDSSSSMPALIANSSSSSAANSAPPLVDVGSTSSTATPSQASDSSGSKPALIANPTTTQMNPASSPHYCGAAPQSTSPTSSMVHRRRHMKHGYRSPAQF